MTTAVVMESNFTPIALQKMQQPTIYHTSYQGLTIQPSDSLLDKPMALLLLQDRLSSSASLSSISSGSGSSSDSSSCSSYNKPLAAIVEDEIVPVQEDGLPQCTFSSMPSKPIFDEIELHEEKPNFRQRIKRIWSKNIDEQAKEAKTSAVKPKRYSVPNVPLQSPSPAHREMKRSFNHPMNGLRRWRSGLHRSSVSNERTVMPDIPVAAAAKSASAVAVKILPRPRALSENNGRLHLHINDHLNMLQEPSQDGKITRLRYSRSLSSVNRLKELLGVRVQPDSTQPKKKVHFDPAVYILPTYGYSQYNRSSDRTNTCYCVNTESAFMIRDELNRYKLHEMEIHVKSRYLTHFIP